MNTIDITTIYSAQAALESRTLNSIRYGWFTYSLATLTSALVYQPHLVISKPPTSNEKRGTPPGLLAGMLKGKNLVSHFQPVPENKKDGFVKETKIYLEDHRVTFQKIFSSHQFWRQPFLHEWLSWHEKNEFISHNKRLGGIAGKEFRKFVLSLGAQSDEEQFTMDVLARGAYYSVVNNGNIWLHPVRAFYLPGKTTPSDLQENLFSDSFIHLVVGTVETKLRKLDTNERMLEWISMIHQARSLPTGMSIQKSDGQAFLAKQWKISKWERLVEYTATWLSDNWKYFEPGLERASDDIKLVIKILNASSNFIKLGATTTARQLDQTYTRQTIETGKRILLLSKKGKS